MTTQFPASIQAALAHADQSWQTILHQALQALVQFDPNYLTQLEMDDYLPSHARLFAAFMQPLNKVQYILVGEGPYPREASATGVCFMDGAVGSLWSDQPDGGLSKQVNRATSLRNLMKMLMVASGKIKLADLNPNNITHLAQQARQPGSAITQTLAQFQDGLHSQGFLLLNASLVFRAHVAPKIEAKPWQIFFEHVLQGLLQVCKQEERAIPTLVLWGKIANDLQRLPVLKAFPQIIAEHPYNISFIGNIDMHQLFAPMDLLQLNK